VAIVGKVQIRSKFRSVAKFKSFLSHIVNKHDSLEDLLFSKCAHGPDIFPCEYLFEGIFQSVY
jgi:hypothetical protein